MLSFWFCCVTRVGYSCVSRNAGGEGKSEYNSEKRKSNRILRKQGTSMSIATVQTLSLLILFQRNSFFFKCSGISEQLPKSLGQWEQRFRSLSDHVPIIVYLVSNWLWFGQNRLSLGLHYLKTPCHLYHMLEKDVLKIYLYGFHMDRRFCAMSSYCVWGTLNLKRQ